MNPEEISQFRVQLHSWFENHQRPLPWRETKDPYRVWVSEVMLQQTQAKTVLNYYQKFLARFPTIQTFAAADLEEVLKFWEGMGYYGRARNFHRAATMVVNEMGGKIPRDYPTFRKLPGVGDYIAAAVLSLAFGEPRSVLDGNVKRVLARLFLVDSPIDASSSLRLCREKAAELLDSRQPGSFNQAMMELGATVCLPRQPRCSACPVPLFCEAHRTGRQDRVPVARERKAIPKHYLAVGIIYKGSQILITRRKPSGLLGGLWEFPGGKVKRGETAAEACIREIQEELNLSVEIIGWLTRIKHAYTHLRIVMDVFRCRYRSGQVVLKGPVDFHWITIDEIDRFPFPRANHKFIPLLKDSKGR